MRYMAIKARTTGTRRPYPRGTPHQLTDGWKIEVDRWLSDNGHTRQWLSRQIDADRTTVDATLNPTAAGGSATSKLVPAICEVTGLPPPTRASSVTVEQAVRLFERLGPEQLAAVIDFAERLVPKAKP